MRVKKSIVTVMSVIIVLVMLFAIIVHFVTTAKIKILPNTRISSKLTTNDVQRILAAIEMERSSPFHGRFPPYFNGRVDPERLARLYWNVRERTASNLKYVDLIASNHVIVFFKDKMNTNKNYIYEFTRVTNAWVMYKVAHN